MLTDLPPPPPGLFVHVGYDPQLPLLPRVHGSSTSTHTWLLGHPMSEHFLPNSKKKKKKQ